MGNVMRDGNTTHLSKRLTSVYNLLGMGNVIADVGCDHGYLPISLVESGRFKRAIAMDINEAPLCRAEQNIANREFIDETGTHNLSEKIETRLSDGISALNRGEADAISICGMGGNVIMHIFDIGQDILPYADKIVIQPQSEYAKLQHHLLLQGYKITDEDITYEDGHYYFVLKLWHTSDTPQDAHKELPDATLGYYHSERLMKQQSQVYREYLEWYLTVCNKAITNIETNSTDTPRLNQLLKEKKLITELKAYG